MSKNKQNGKLVPKLRFPEFAGDGEWEEKELFQITPLIFDGTHQTPKYTEKGIPFFSVENIISGKKNKYISKEDYIIATKKNKPEIDDILITRIGNIGYSKVINWSYDFSIYVTLAVIKKSDYFISNYLHSYLQSFRFQREIRSKSLLNATPCKINMDELRKTEVLLPPKKPEQQKIANCLSSLDNVIEAQAEKLDSLKEHKKGLLQRLFPAEGETVPKLRFSKFSGEWEKTILSQLANYENGKAHEKEISESGNYIVINSKFISSDGEVVKRSNSANCKANIGDILMVLSDVPNGKAIAKCFYVNKNNTYTVNQRICKITPTNIENMFLFYILNKNAYFLSFDDGVKQTNLRKNDVLNCPLLTPKDKKEQQKIANCLSSLDSVIEAQSEKIETLKAHKKGLMQQLFPDIDGGNA